MKTSINPDVPLSKSLYLIPLYCKRFLHSCGFKIQSWNVGWQCFNLCHSVECFRMWRRRLLAFVSCLSVSSHKTLRVLNRYISITGWRGVLRSIRFQCRRQQSLIVFHVVRGYKRFLFILWCYVPAFDPLFYLQAHLTSSGEIENEKWRYSLPVCDITGLQNKRQSKQIIWICITIIYLSLKHTMRRDFFFENQTDILNVVIWFSFKCLDTQLSIWTLHDGIYKST